MLQSYYLCVDLKSFYSSVECVERGLDPLTTNLIIHGHNMKSGAMFGNLTDFESSAYYEDHKQIILTSDKPPKDIQPLEERLRTRFEWGLTVDIQPPDYETRMAIIKTKANSLGLELSDEVVPGGEIRVISSEAAVCVSEAVPCEGGVGCRGDAVLRLLLCREGEGEMPFVTVRRIPFAVTVPVDGADGLSCRAQGQCTDLEAEVTDDGRVLCRLSVTVSAEGQGNVPVMYTSDLYATHRESSAVYTEYVFPVAARCISGNFTQSVYEPLSAFGLAEDCEVLDVCASAAVDDVSCDRGKWVLSGESRIHLLLRSGEEYATHEMSLPFRYETDGEGGEPMLCAVDVQMVSGRARVDGGRLGIECEMAVSARICTEGRLTALSEAQIGEVEPVPSETVVAFPARGETVWSLAKRYRVPLATLSRLNALPESPSAVLETGAPVVVNE